MKLRCWILGIAVVVTGSMIAMKCFADCKKRLQHFVDNDKENNLSEFSQEIIEPEFDDVNFIA